jgi:hypothetical protein
MHPPVYYEGIVKRPYGISPFAAPPGVLPVEMTIKVEPKTVLNPLYKNKIMISPAENSVNPKMTPEIKKENKSKKKTIDITTPAATREPPVLVASKKVINPFYKKKTTLDRHAF